MGVIDRVIGDIAAGTVPLRRSEITAEAERLLTIESPRSAGALAQGIADRILGMGPLEPLLADSLVTDILVNGPDEIWVDRGGALTRADGHFAGDADLLATVERVIAPLGLRVDRSSPTVDGRLADPRVRRQAAMAELLEGGRPLPPAAANSNRSAAALPVPGLAA